ncbi:MAG: hypothetical protein H0X18_07250 [Geodermatophilaceae bacterium]|nr:hypothetical protein [Geodermatophilaceae bacterium]
MPRLISGSFVTGGTVLLAGSALHPHEHVDGGTLEEQFHAMFSDSHWYPAHVLLLVGLALMTVAVVGLARTTPASLPGRTTRFAAVATLVGTAAMVLHLFTKLDDAHIMAGENTPLLYTHAAVETVTVPMLGIAVAMLAVAGGRSRVLGNPFVAVLGVVGGLGYALAGVTAPFMSTFTPLFDLVSLVGVWAMVVGAMQLVRGRHTRTLHEVAR